MLRALERVCPHIKIVGMDVFAEGLHYAHRRTSCAIVRGDVQNPPFCGEFDLIGLFDVLEHLRDDTSTLEDLGDLLAPGGALMLTVPAHMSLWGQLDEESRHHRRYETDEIARKLALTGYRIEYLTEFMGTVFPLVWLRRRLSRPSNQHSSCNESDMRELASELNVPRWINELLALALLPEMHLVAHRCRLPIGTSLLAIARRELAMS